MKIDENVNIDGENLHDFSEWLETCSGKMWKVTKTSFSPSLFTKGSDWTPQCFNGQNYEGFCDRIISTGMYKYWNFNLILQRKYTKTIKNTLKTIKKYKKY